MRRLVTKFCHASCALISIGLAADAQPGAIPTLRGNLVSELIDPVVPISGEGLAGFIMAGPADLIDPDQLYVYLPRTPDGGQLTISLSSPDGRYLATWRAAVGPGLTGWARIDYPGSAHARLAALKIDQLAALASDGKAVYPLRWQSPGFADRMTIMINAERAEAFAVERDGERRRRVDCRPVEGRQAIRFDRICSLDRNRAEILGGVLEIRRRKSGQHLTSLSLKLAE